MESLPLPFRRVGYMNQQIVLICCSLWPKNPDEKKQKATEQTCSYGICLISPQGGNQKQDRFKSLGSWLKKKKKDNNEEENTWEKHRKREIKMKELKITSPGMLPNLSNLSAAAVE